MSRCAYRYSHPAGQCLYNAVSGEQHCHRHQTDRPHPDLDAPLSKAEADEVRRVMNEGVTRARTFGQRLRELRRGRGITLREAAEKIGRDFTYLSKIENDRCLPPSAEVIVALADLLDGDAEELAILGDKPPIAVVRRQLMEAVAEVRRLRAAQAAALAWARDRGYLEPDYADEDYPCDELWTAMIDALRALAGGTDTSDAR